MPLSDDETALREQIKLFSDAVFQFDLEEPISELRRDSFTGLFNALICSAGDYKDEVDRLLGEPTAALGLLDISAQQPVAPDRSAATGATNDKLYEKLVNTSSGLVELLLKKGLAKNKSFDKDSIVASKSTHVVFFW